jgi:hypothetical protein
MMTQPIFRLAALYLSLGLGCTEYEVKAQLDPVDGGEDSSATDTAGQSGPDIGVDPLTVELGSLCTLDGEEVVITSMGGEAVTILSIDTGGSDWSISSPPALPRDLLPGQSMSVWVQSQGGEGTLFIESNDPDTPVWQVPLSASTDSPPTLVISSPGDGDVLDIGAMSTLEATISDADQAVEDLTVEWRSDIDGLLGSAIPDSSGVATLVWDASTQSSGDHTITATVYDFCEHESSDAVQVCQNEGYVEEGLDLSTWNFEGSAQWDSANSWVELTNTGTDRAGTAFQTSTTVDSDSISIEFSFFVSGGSGADGISLTALDSTRMSGFVGSTGGGIGYAGLPGWSIEVDTWYNGEYNDPTQGDHLSVHIDGNSHSFATWAALPEMEDGNWHQMAVTVSGSWMTVSVDGTTYIDESISGLGAFPAYVGFTAATGAATNWHLIDSLEVEGLVCDD